MDSKLLKDDVTPEEEVEGELDPRVQGELEALNSACLEINTLENELEKAKKRFQRMRIESLQKLNNVQQKLGSCVVKSKPYFDYLIQLEKAQNSTQKTAIEFQESNDAYLNAKKLVSAAEERMINDLHEKRPFDAAMQEMLNHATMQFSEAEKEKEHCETEHFKWTQECANIKEKIKLFEKEHPKNIAKSRPYFELKSELEGKLLSEKWNIEDLQRGLSLAKEKYRLTLHALEKISEEVHMKRRYKIHFNLPERTPGVGAEAPDENMEISRVSLDMMADTLSCTSIESSDSCFHYIGDGASFHGDKLDETREDEMENIITNFTEKVDIAQINNKCNETEVAGKSKNISGSNQLSFSADRATFLRMKTECSDTISVNSSASYDGLRQLYNKDSNTTQQASTMLMPHNKKVSRNINSKAAFPILMGLSETNQRYSPKLPRSKVSHTYEQVLVESGGASITRQHSESRLLDLQNGKNLGNERLNNQTFSPLTGGFVLTHIQRPSMAFQNSNQSN